jgi:CRP/FNR family transcriptional regulator
MLDQLKPLIEAHVSRRINSGSTILYQGEIPRSACILTKGLARVIGISEQGEEQIILFHVPGEFFPASWIFGKTSSSMFFYEAVSDCEVTFIPKIEFVEYMQSDADKLKLMLDYFTTNYSASLLHINALEQPKARDKLLYILYFLCQRYGSVKGNKFHIPFALTHQNLASLVGLTRETTATEMNKLKKKHVLSYQNQNYVVDINQLHTLIGEDSFRDIHIGV